MNRQKVLKYITVFLCALLALVMILTMVLPLMASAADEPLTGEQPEQTLETQDNGTGIIVEMTNENLVEELQGLSFCCKVAEITEENDEYGVFYGFLNNGTYSNIHIYNVYSTEIYSLEEIEEDGELFPADTPFSPAIFAEPTVHYVPYLPEYEDNAGLCVLTYDYISYSFSCPQYSIVKVDGQKYLKFSSELWAYIAICCETDSEGNVIPLKFWEKGFIGTLYNMRVVIALVLVGIAMMLLFFKPAKKPGAKIESEEKTQEADSENNRQ